MFAVIFMNRFIMHQDHRSPEAVIADAMANKRVVEILVDREPFRRKFVPYVIYYGENRQLCLDGYQLLNPNMRNEGQTFMSFSMSRISQARVTEETFVPPEWIGCVMPGRYDQGVRHCLKSLRAQVLGSHAF